MTWPVGGGTVGELGLGRPLTERILDRLGSPRWRWILVWVSTALVAPLVLLTVLWSSNDLDRVRSVSELLISQLVLAYVVGLCLWGVGRLMRGARALEPQLARLTSSEPPTSSGGSNVDVAGPVLLTAVISIVNTAGAWLRYGPWAALAVAPLLAVSLLAIMTFAWTYVQLLLGLDRLGRRRLALDQFPQDRSLGLGAVGSLAFAGFAILFGAAIPILVTGSANLVTVAVSLVLVAVNVALFFLSMWRLHRQMARARAAHVARTRALYELAYAPLRAAASVEALGSQASALTAAQALMERAERILTWPVDERVTAWMAIIVTGVVTSLIVRVLFAAAGL